MHTGRRLCALIALLGAAAGASAQRTEVPETTGTHAGATAGRLAVVRLNRDSEIDEILGLIQNGDDQAALERARAYVASLSGQVPGDESVPATTRYFALNALCIALTRVRELDEAVSVCTEAIALDPGEWTALNSRGTAHFAAGRYQEALDDYRGARLAATDDAAATETIDHNIDLTNQRLTAD